MTKKKSALIELINKTNADLPLFIGKNKNQI